METIIHTPGSLSVPGISRALQEYSRRITDWPLNHRVGLPSSPSPEEMWVGMTIEGTMTRTEGLHRWLRTRANRSVRCIRFLIGGKEGLESVTLKRTQWRWSLGPLVMNQSIAALVVAEQLYRCFALRTGHPYHRSQNTGSH